MTYRGTVKNGVVVLEKSDALPEGAEVRVELASAHPPGQRPIMALAGKARGLPPDASETIEASLYGPDE